MATKLSKIVADFVTQLAATMLVGATTGTLQSVTDDDGVALTNGVYYFTLDGNNSNKEYIQATITGTSMASIKTVSRQGTLVAGTVRQHRAGCLVEVTDFAAIKMMMNILDGTDGLNASVPLAYDGAPVLTPGSNQLATVAYAESLANQGAATASTSTKGIIKVSTAPVDANSPIAVGDNDTRVPTQAENDAMVGTSGSPSSTNKFVTNDDTSAGSSASKVLRQDAAGKIALALFDIDKMPAHYFTQAIPGPTQGASQGTASGSDATGDTIFIHHNNATELYRYARDSATGAYIQTHKVNVTTPVPNGVFGSIVVIGIYVYLFTRGATNVKVYRYLAADLTGETDMTVPVLAAGSSVLAWTNGTDMWLVVANSNTTSRKWTISGTTISDSGVTGTVTASIFDRYDMASMWDGTTAYIFRTNGGTGFSSTVEILKLTNIDGSTYGTTTKTIGPFSDADANGLIVNISTAKCYIGCVSVFYDEAAVISSRINLIPVTKP